MSTDVTERPLENTVRFGVSTQKYCRPLDGFLFPVVAVGVTKCGKFRFYRLTFYWWKRGIEFSVGRGPFSLVKARLKNLMDSLREEESNA